MLSAAALFRMFAAFLNAFMISYLRCPSLLPFMRCRKAVELSGSDPRVRAGLYGNVGALLMGAAGRLEDALEYSERAIEAGKEMSIPDNTLTAGTISH